MDEHAADTRTYAAFSGHRALAAGPLIDVAHALASAVEDGTPQVLIFDDVTGEQIELDVREGAETAVREYRLRTASPAQPRPAGRGRPKLGVVAREVTLLPRHWEWLAAQPGGASAALRRLVEAARVDPAEHHRRRRDALYRAMSSLAGDLPDFEEATRALYADDAERFASIVSAWPPDAAAYLLGLKDG